MNILINLSNHIGGGSLQVALSFINECRKIINNNYFIVFSSENQNLIDKALFPENFLFYMVSYKYYVQLPFIMKKLEEKLKPDVVFTVFGPSYWKPKAPHLIGYANCLDIYFESPFWKTCNIKQKIIISLKRIIHLYSLKRDADAIVCETEDVTQRIQKLLNLNDISYFTVSNTCSEYYRNEDWRAVPRKLAGKDNDEFRFLYLTKYYTHKNIEIISKVVDELHKQGINYVRFILTIDSEIYKRIIPENYRKEILCVGAVPMNEGPALYSECDAVFMPSFLECFSANYPEAMAMQKPIIASDFGFSRTICENAALYFNSCDPYDAAEKIVNLIQNKNLRDSLIKNGIEQLKKFNTPEERVKKDLEICSKLISKSGRK